MDDEDARLVMHKVPMQECVVKGRWLRDNLPGVENQSLLGHLASYFGGLSSFCVISYQSRSWLRPTEPMIPWLLSVPWKRMEMCTWSRDHYHSQQFLVYYSIEIQACLASVRQSIAAISLALE